MKHRDLVKQINQIAQARGQTARWTQGGNHAKVTLGEITIAVPRHSEINELTAQAILRQARKA